jgi:hypothetical protein
MRTISGFFAIAILGVSPLLAADPKPAAPASPPPLFTVQEHNRDGRNREVEEPLNIVDIGSDLTITLDKAAIAAAIGKSGFVTAEQSQLLARLPELQKLLELRSASLDSLKRSLSAYARAVQGDPSARAEAKTQMTAAAKPLNDFLQQIPDTSPFNAALGASLENRQTIPDRFTAVFDVATAQLHSLEQQLSASTPSATGPSTGNTGNAGANGVYVQLGAWIVTDSGQRPIHLDGFDDYPTGTTFVINRWNLTLTPEQQQELAQYSQLATQVNDKGLQGLIDWKTTGQQVLSQLDQTPTGKCAQGLVDQVNTLAKAPQMQVQQIQGTLMALQASLAAYRQSLLDIRARYVAGGSATQLSPDQFLAQTNTDITTLVNTTNALVNGLDAGVTSIAAAVKSALPDAKQALGTLETQVKQCADTAKTDAASALADLQGTLHTLIAGRQVDVASLEFGDQVRKLSLDSLPGSTTVNLNQTGVREAGDVIAIKIAAGTTPQNRQDLAYRQLTMFQVIPHLDLKVGLIYANAQGQPSTTSTTTTTVDTTKNKHHFQAAPAYSILFKKGSYTSANYNRWIDAGIGLNLSSLDFNHDDVQELGIAIVGSVFRDYLQLGYGYNVTESRRYWFFGLRLPLPYFTLPLANNSTPAPK